MIQTERRDTALERRRQVTPAFSRYFLLGRRRALRRESDGPNYYVDRPAEEANISAALLLVLSLLDALLSLRLFSLGTSHEVNPLLAFTLSHGVGLFLLVKMALTASATFVLLVHWNFILFGRFALASVTRLLISLYIGLIVYEMLLLVRG